jgi:hypothetical protein
MTGPTALTSLVGTGGSDTEKPGQGDARCPMIGQMLLANVLFLRVQYDASSKNRG